MESSKVTPYTYIWLHIKMLVTLLRRKEEYNTANKKHATPVKLNVHMHRKMSGETTKILSMFISG